MIENRPGAGTVIGTEAVSRAVDQSVSGLWDGRPSYDTVTGYTLAWWVYFGDIPTDQIIDGLKKLEAA